MNCRLPLLLLALALTAGCNDTADKDRRTASGEVLEGTISDAMLPLDTVQSQPPLMKAEVKKAAADADATEAQVSDDEAPAGPTGEAAPTAAPAVSAAAD